jgi:glucuronate isomerase
MRSFIHDDFLLGSNVAADLYHRHAKDLPVIDYHCHLSPELMAANHRFANLTELWLAGDHYKWRGMRADGVPERLITGDASDWEKFAAWAAVVPHTLRNPLYHWTHMELRRPFGIDVLLSPKTAKDVYERANELLQRDEFTTMGLLEQFKVAVVCSTDDPVDSLAPHAELARRPDPVTRVYPTWRPDKAIAVEDAKAWNAWVLKLEAASGMAVGSFEGLLSALDHRHAFFHAQGCRASDHGVEQMPSVPWRDAEVAATFDKLRAGQSVGADDALAFKSAVLHRLALFDHARGWVQQFHLGALRGNNTRLQRTLGPDTGFDSIADVEQARPLQRFLDKLDSTDQLPKTILYNLNPADNEVFASMCGNFQDGTVPGKMQFGTAWWFLDQKDGMEAQMRALSNLGLLSRFVGMITDSRSFVSYSRHDYFRRLLCNLLGEDVRQGLLPDDRELLGQLVRDVCFFNARGYFGFPLGRAAAGVA